MPEEKATINEGSADLSGPDEATKDKISESILARAKRISRELQEKVEENFLTSPKETLYKNLKKDRLEGEADRKDFYDQKRALGNSAEGAGGDYKNANQEAPDKFGEGRKQYIQSSEMERRRKKMQENKEEKLIKRRPQSLVRQMASFQANKNMALREGIREIREENNRKKGNEGGAESTNNPTDSDESRAANLKMAKQNDKDKVGANVKIDKMEVGKSTQMRAATDNFLKSMIEMVPETFTLSAFYVYIHVFLHQIFPNYFSKLGHEWVPDNIKRVSPKKAEEIGDKIGIAEKPAVGCCCLFHLVVIIIICAIIYFMVNWGEVAWEWFKGLFS